MASILIVYHSESLKPRATIIDHLYSFGEYTTGHDCFYLNTAAKAPRVIARRAYDLVIFHYSFVSMRIVPDKFAMLSRRIEFLKNSSAKKVMLPQDEQNRADILCRFINEFGVTHVFSCAKSSEWSKAYRDVDFSKVSFDTVLTGYIAEKTVERIESLAKPTDDRPIDIGYRSWDPWPYYGRHGRLKGDIARVFMREAPKHDLKIDISNSYADAILGDDWFRFLLKCKYTIGVEGGTSIIDFDGSLDTCTKAFLAENPDATFEETEAACFPGMEGSFDYAALSPRHLDACITKTGQVLIEGWYGGALRPGDHYIELKRDFSNLGEVLESVKRDDLRAAMVTRAYRDIVESGDWSYRHFVELVLSASVPGWTLDGPVSSDRTSVGRDQFALRLQAIPVLLRSTMVAMLERLMRNNGFRRVYMRLRGYPVA